jgi:hypothetical protein
VQVDEARCERLPFCVNAFRGLFVEVADSDDSPVTHAYVAVTGGRPGAVDYLRVADQQI